jgi:hypothetical protein
MTLDYAQREVPGRKLLKAAMVLTAIQRNGEGSMNFVEWSPVSWYELRRSGFVQSRKDVARASSRDPSRCR